MATAYEWAVEEMDGEDVEDTHTFDTLAEAKAAMCDGDVLVLRKLKSNRDGDSVESFAYAYPKGDVLPVEFDDGSCVPERFHREMQS